MAKKEKIQREVIIGAGDPITKTGNTIYIALQQINGEQTGVRVFSQEKFFFNDYSGGKPRLMTGKKTEYTIPTNYIPHKKIQGMLDEIADKNNGKLDYTPVIAQSTLALYQNRLDGKNLEGKFK